ncbi:MAG: response regulator [Polyangiaceae bacterium]|nr:response regulator [Polyangiaceae bacterium]
MTTTLLAVDDSVSMRKVFEITFAGEEFRVVSADGADAALAKAKSEKPNIALVDVGLPGTDGYAVCRSLKSELPGILVVLLSSKQTPYDAAKGTACGADDHADKPFDTQAMIDRVKKVSTAKAAMPDTAAPPPIVPPPRAPLPSAPSVGGTIPGTQAPGGPPAPAPRPMAASAPTVQRPAAPAAPKPAVAPTPPKPAAAPAAPKPAAPAAPVAAAPPPAAAPSPVAAAVNGAMTPALSNLGLTPAQADAVLALSREVVERVVWEVVPVLAETLIKEEISRLTKEG